MMPLAARNVVSTRGGPFRAIISLPAVNPETVSQTTGQPIVPQTQPVQGPYLVSNPPAASPVGTEYLEYPAAGNVPPSTSPYAYIDPTTGQVLSPVVGTPIVDTITSWVQANPILALGLAAGVVWLLMEFFGGGGDGRSRRHR